LRRTLIAGQSINQICHQFHQTPKDHPNTDDARLPSFSCSPTKLVAGSRRAATTTASALPLAELAAVGPEIAETAVTCFAITLVGLAIGFVLLRVEAAVEGEE
jgi:phage-related baseplate assembly protein